MSQSTKMDEIGLSLVRSAPIFSLIRGPRAPRAAVPMPIAPGRAKATRARARGGPHATPLVASPATQSTRGLTARWLRPATAWDTDAGGAEPLRPTIRWPWSTGRPAIRAGGAKAAGAAEAARADSESGSGAEAAGFLWPAAPRPWAPGRNWGMCHLESFTVHYTASVHQTDCRVIYGTKIKFKVT